MKALPDLEVIGAGAVHSGGCSVAALRDPLPAPTPEALLSKPEEAVPVRRVPAQAGALARWQKEPRLRRASPLAHYLVEAVAQATQGVDLPGPRIGFVTVMGVGAIVPSRKFFADTLSRGRRFASPALFPETVYNSPASHVAAVHGFTTATATLMGDESAWADALRVAQLWLARGTVEAVVVAAGEEYDASVGEAWHAAGWTRRGLVATEGAGAVLVRAHGKHATGPALRPRPRPIPFRNRGEQAAAWAAMVKELKDSDPSAPVLFPSPLAPPPLGEKLVALGAEALPEGPGTAFAAAAAWGLLRALDLRAGAPFHLLLPGTNAAIGGLSVGASR